MTQRHLNQDLIYVPESLWHEDLPRREDKFEAEHEGSLDLFHDRYMGIRSKSKLYELDCSLGG